MSSRNVSDVVYSASSICLSSFRTAFTKYKFRDSNRTIPDRINLMSRPCSVICNFNVFVGEFFGSVPQSVMLPFVDVV